MLLEIKDFPRRNPSGRGCILRICVLKCDVCGTVYERPRSKAQLEAKIHRCSLKCTYGSRSTDGIGGHGAGLIRYACTECGKECKRLACGDNSNGERGRFCSSKCYGNWLSQHSEAYSKNTSAMHTPEVAAKISKLALERMSQPGYVHSQTGLKRTDETRALMRQRKLENPPVGDKNGMFGRKHSDKAKNAMSEKHADLLVNGRQRPYGRNSQKETYVTKNGSSYFSKSGWELAMMKWLDMNNDVMSWNYECVKIPYIYDNHKRWYVPDFLVEFIDGHRELWEIKPKEFVDTEKNKLKAAAAHVWCAENNIASYSILTGDDLREMRII